VEYSIKKGSINDLNNINYLIDSYFGYEFHKTKDIIGEKSIIIIALYKNKLVGFTHGKAISSPGSSSKDAAIGLLDMLIVDHNHRRKGIGSALFKARQKEFEAINITQYELNHWVRKASPTPRLAIQAGFVKFKTNQLFWQKDSVKFNFQCPECGPPPCKCACDSYQKGN
jgi:GNAT superfamily N-acetyltransferase